MMMKARASRVLPLPRALVGTSSSMSSVVRIHDRHDDSRRAQRLCKTREVPHGSHHDLIDEQPDDDRWRAEQMSLIKRTTEVKAVMAAIFGHIVPASIPIGVPIALREW